MVVPVGGLVIGDGAISNSPEMDRVGPSKHFNFNCLLRKYKINLFRCLIRICIFKIHILSIMNARFIIFHLAILRSSNLYLLSQIPFLFLFQLISFAKFPYLFPLFGNCIKFFFTIIF